MKVKHKSRMFISAFAALLIALTGMLVILFGNDTLLVFAATTPKYTLAYDYTHYYNYNTSKTVDGSGKDALSVSVKGDNGNMTTVKFYIYGSPTSGTANLSKGGAIASSSLTITLDASIQGYNMSVTNSSGAAVGSQSGKNYSLSNLSDGLYTFTCSLRGAGWNPNSRAFAWYSMDVSSSFVVDTVAPSISGASTSSTGKYTNQSFTVTARDSASGIEAIYWRNPSAASYSSTSDPSKTVTAGSTNGLYRFYAVDKAGNISATYYVYYDNVAPVGKVTASGGMTIPSGGSTNDSFSYTASDIGSGISSITYKTPSSSAWKTYTAGTTISATAEQGTYTFKATDKAGNSEIYTINLSDPCSAGHDYISSIISPTCTSGGYTKYTCSRCGTEYTNNTVSAFGHSYTAKTTAATCTNGGFTIYTCTRCNYSYKGNTTSATGHSYTATVTLSTCMSTGYTTYKCTKCGYSYTGNTTAALGHSYEAVTTSSTCTKEGYTTYKCTRCGISHTDSPTQATGHSYVASITEPTCTERGYTIFICTKCSDTYRDNETEALGHNYANKIVSASCMESGYTVYICTRCNYSYTGSSTQPTGHSYVTTTVAATCMNGGYSLHTCSICRESYRDNITQPLGHNYISATRETTCTQGGGTVYTCQVCGYEYSDNNGTYPKGHNYTTTIITAPTCTTEGLRRSVCDDCGDTFATVIAANGHNYVITDAVSENGITTRTYTCDKCGDVYTQELGDQYEEVSNYVEYLFEQYAPYMWWVLLAATGIWSIVMGVFFAIAQKHEDKEKAKKMIINYVIGLVVIAIIVVACPYLVRGIAALVTWQKILPTN